MTNAHYFRIDVPESAGGGASAAHVRRCVCPRRCRGLTEGVTARAVGFRTTAIGDEVSRAVRSEMRYYGSGAVVRRADPFSVNPGQRVRG